MLVIASRTNADAVAVPPPFLPGGNLGENIVAVLNNEDAKFLLGLTNSFIVATVVTVSVVIISTLAGFSFANLNFRGRNLLLVLVPADDGGAAAADGRGAALASSW